MNLTSSRRADEFARLLDAGELTDHPVDGPMLALSQALQSMPTVDGPRPEFRQALRQRLVAVATVQGVGAPAETPMTKVREAGRNWRVQRRLTALAAGAAVATSVSGVALGATRSVPGDPFYSVKKAAESVQLAATVGTEARGKRHLEFAQTRLDEVVDLAKHHDTARVVSTLHTMDVETRDGANDLLAAYRQSGSLEPLRTLSQFSAQQYARLHALLPTLPVAAQAPARGSLALLAVVAGRTLDTARSATGLAPVPATPVVPRPAGSTPAGSTSSSPGSVVPGTSPTAAPQPGVTSSGPSSSRSSQQPLPNPTSLLPSVNPLPTSVLPTTLLPSSLPSVLPSVQGSLTSPLPLPSIATIPPLPASTPLPTVLPTLPSLLPGVGG